MSINLNATTSAYPGWKSQWGIDEFFFAMQGNDLQHSKKADKVEASGFGQQYKTTLPGMHDGSLKIKGLYTGGLGSFDDVMTQRFGRTSAVNAWYAYQGLTVLSPIVMQPSSINDYSTNAKLKDAVDFNLELDSRGAVDNGFILLSPATLLTAASGTGSLLDFGTSVGATTYGAAAQLHIWAIDGGTSPSVQVNIQHSPDGTTWTNLLTFSSATAIGSQRLTVPTGTTINQKIQATWTLTGSPTDVQVLVGFARNPNFNA